MAGKRRIDELKLSSEQQEKLIELYQSETDLWNVSSPTYSKKECRQRALNNIKEKKILPLMHDVPRVSVFSKSIVLSSMPYAFFYFLNIVDRQQP